MSEARVATAVAALERVRSVLGGLDVGADEPAGPTDVYSRLRCLIEGAAAVLRAEKELAGVELLEESRQQVGELRIRAAIRFQHAAALTTKSRDVGLISTADAERLLVLVDEVLGHSTVRVKDIERDERGCPVRVVECRTTLAQVKQ